ncbi:hypothetical protein MK280_14230, partial [Myxococcota bacterium]|nr:hypothetical protein [Myxococcota bacterium]
MKKIRIKTIGVVTLLAMLAAPSLSSAFSNGGTRKAAPRNAITQVPPSVAPGQEERSAAPVPEPGALLLFGAGALVA